MSDFIQELRTAHDACITPCRLRSESEKFAKRCLALLFPEFSPPDRSTLNLKEEVAQLQIALTEMLEMVKTSPDRQEGLCHAFFGTLPRVRRMLLDDAQATYDHDPAAESLTEVILAYPGFYAISIYRIAHELYRQQVPLIPRLLTEFAHRETGIDIHPGAQVGARLTIDHGTGLVIGETAEIGDDVTLYQGVTIGALSVSKALSNKKRHPTIEAGVIIYANATILGGKTVIGRNTTIGGNAWITRSVPPNSTVTNKNEIQPKEE